MIRNLNLRILTTGNDPIEIPVHIDKITDPKTTLNTLYQGRRVRQVMVLTKDDVEKPTKLEDVETIVDRSTTTSGLEVKAPDGQVHIVSIDKSIIGETTATTRNLTVVAVVPETEIRPYQYDGTSYELSVHGKTTKKVKQIDPKHNELFNILFHGLRLKKCLFIARYVSFGREKYAAIYPVDINPVSGLPQQALLMTNLIHSSYYRNFTSVNVIGEDVLNAGLSAPLPSEITKVLKDQNMPAVVFFFNQITKAVPTRLSKNEYEDTHEVKLKAHIAHLSASIIKGEIGMSTTGLSFGQADTNDEIIDDDAAPVIVPTHLQMLLNL